jgi:RNA polymerase sigma factor (sigma-70 family)
MDSDISTLRTRSSLLEGIKDPANQKRWADFVDTYSDLIRTGARRVGLRTDEIEVVVQTVLIEVSQKIGEFAYDRSKGKFRSWLNRVTTCRAIDQLRKRRKHEENKLHKSPDDPGNTPTIDRQEDLDETGLMKLIDEEWTRALLENTLKRVRARVSPEQYQLYDARMVKGWEVVKVAKVFSVTKNQVSIANTRIGKLVREEGRKVAEEMNNPDMPPVHPGLNKPS